MPRVSRFRDRSWGIQDLRPGGSLTEDDRCRAEVRNLTLEYVWHDRPDGLGLEAFAGLGGERWDLTWSYDRTAIMVTAGGAIPQSIQNRGRREISGVGFAAGLAYGWSRNWSAAVRLTTVTGTGGSSSASCPTPDGFPVPDRVWDRGNGSHGTTSLTLRFTY